MTKFQPLQKIHKLYLGLSRLHAAKYSDKSSRPLECTNFKVCHDFIEKHLQIKFQNNRFRKIVFTKKYNDWIIICYLTMSHHFLSAQIVFGIKKF